MTPNDIELSVAAKNGRDARLVIARFGEDGEFRSTFNVNSDVSRDRFVRKLSAKTGIEMDDLADVVDGRLIAMADQADAEAAEAAEVRRQQRQAVAIRPLPDMARVDQRTEAATARRFVAMHGENVRYCAPWGKWLLWDGKRWKIDDTCAVEALAKRTADAIWEEVKEELPRADRAYVLPLVSFAKATASANGIAHMLTLARSEPGIAILPAQLDSHPWLFNCMNGTVDLKTGERLSHRRQHYITKICPHEYVQGAEGECPFWEESLEKIFSHNARVLGFFRRLCGAAMAGEVIEHILPILWGGGSNGKSLVVETLLEAFGTDYADKGASDLLLASQGDRHPTEKADLFGRRLVVCTETENGRRLAESTVKELCGGDTVKARRMREDYWSFKPAHTLMLVTNHKPLVGGTDHGIWRRLRLIPFTQTFWDASKGEIGEPEYQADPRLKEKLRPERPGILRWLVDACREWQREGLGQAEEVTAATAEYRDAMDVLAAFVAECCITLPGVSVKASELRRAYEDWSKASGEYPVSGRRFGEYLRERGISKRPPAQDDPAGQHADADGRDDQGPR